MTLRLKLGTPMANLGACSATSMPVSGCGIDFGGRNKCQPPRDAMLFGDTAVMDGDYDCVTIELASDCEEIVPDSDDEAEIGRQEKLGKGTMMGGEEIVLENQCPVINGLPADDEEEHGIVADSEEECDEGKQRVMNEHGGFSGSSDIFGKKKFESLNGSQQPGELSQADALEFIDHFLMCNDLDLLSEDKSKSHLKHRSPPKSSCSKGVQILAQKISNRTPAVGFGSYDRTDREPNKQGRIFKGSDVLFYSRRRKRCATDKPMMANEHTRMRSIDDSFCSISSHQQDNKEVTNLSSETNDDAQIGITLISGSEEVENLVKTTKPIIGNIYKDSDVETCPKQQDSGGDGGNEALDDVFNTQMAAAVMETLSFEPPEKCKARVLSDSFQTIITDSPKDFKEKEANLGYPSLQNGSYSGLKQNGDRLKHKKRTFGESGSHKSTFHENDGRVDPQFSTGKEDTPCNEKNVSGKLFRTGVERKRNRECINKVYKEPYQLSLDYKVCRGFSKSGFDNKFSSSTCPLRWMSKAQQSPKQETKDSKKDLVHTYKRRRSAMARKESASPNVNFDSIEVKNNIESGKQHRSLSNVILNCAASNTLIFPEGKRTSQGSSSIKHLDSIGNEKEVKSPLAKRYKPVNHCAEPDWVKFSRKKRTSVACNKQVKGMDSCKAKAAKRSIAHFNEFGPGVGDTGKKTTFDDSNAFYGSNSLTSVSSNSSLVPPVSSLNSAYFEKLSPKKMPKSSLIRELIQLGYSDIPIDTLTKNLRRRKHVENIRVLFSQHLDSNTIMHQKRVLARLGISIATSISDATHFVTNTFSRTKNMLEAIALGIPIVTQLWLESCVRAGCLVHEKSYIMKDSKKEREIGFSLSASLAKAARYPLLKNHKVFITPSIKPDKDMLSSLVKMVQGEVVEITKNYRIPDDVIVLSCEEDYAICTPFLEKGTPIYHSELLLNGIVTQKLEVQRHQLFVDKVKGPPHMLKN